MSADAKSGSSGSKKSSATRFFLRGLAIVLPVVLTFVIVIWIGNIVNNYIISPISFAVRYTIAQAIQNSRPTDELVFWDKLPALEYCGKEYRITPDLKSRLEQRKSRLEKAYRDEHNGQPGETLAAVPVESAVPVEWITSSIVYDKSSKPQVYVNRGELSVPYRDFQVVARRVSLGEIPLTAIGVYMEFVTIEYFGSHFLLSAVTVSIAIVLLYFIGRLVTVRLGGWLVHRVETLVLGRLPVISTVYASAKQVTDFFFSERQIEYNRVVAVEYPRRGVWSIGFVTGDSMLEITAAAGAPLVTLLIPTSPMPVTGYTISVPRADILDLNMTVDQAFQFCVSCGVLIPPQQQITPELLKQELAKRLTGDALTTSTSDDDPPPT
jgi:uncharacterized membrane protein